MIRSMISSVLAMACMSSVAMAQEEDEPTFDAVGNVRENGFSGIFFSHDCVSVGLDGTVIDGETLPVGGDRWLECHTADPVFRATTLVVDDEDQEWCALGEVTDYSPSNDSRLDIEITETSTDGPWSLRATASGEPFEISMGSFHGAYAWPVGVKATYRTVSVEANPDSLICDDLFGL